MSSNFESSFIPKDPSAGDSLKRKNVGVVGVVVVSFFALAIISALGLFVYKMMVKGDIETLRSEMAAAESAIDKNSIDEMLHFSRKLNFIKSIIVKHQVVSNFLDQLSSSTVSTVTFNEFNYGNITDFGLAVNMKGQTNSYASLALQEKLFNENPNFKSVSFSGLRLSESGNVEFAVSLSVDPSVSVYKIPVIEATEIKVLEDSQNDVVEEVDDENLKEIEELLDNL